MNELNSVILNSTQLTLGNTPQMTTHLPQHHFRLFHRGYTEVYKNTVVF